MRWLMIGVAAAGIGQVAALPAHQGIPPQAFRSTAGAVTVDATVQDRSRRPITGLQAADFDIYDNGVLQEITDVAYDSLPIDITVALDVSYSVSGALLDRLQRGVTQLMADFREQDRLRLVLFNSRIARTVDFTRDTAHVMRAMKEVFAGGGTALLDSISVVLAAPAPADRRQLLVVFTDGLDSTSTTTPDLLAAVAQRGRSAVTLVLPATEPGLNTPGTYVPPNTVLSSYNTLAAQNARDRAAPTVAPRPLDRLFVDLAASTGGSIVPTSREADLTITFRRILADFRAAYLLRYNVRGSEVAGFHEIEVKVKREGVTVKARRGYWR
jgi:VWFA-related protein